MPELMTPTAAPKAASPLPVANTSASNAAASSPAANGEPGSADSTPASFAAALKSQVDKLTRQDAAVASADSTKAAAIDALAPDATSETLAQSGFPAFFGELIPLLAQRADAAQTGDSATVSLAADPALAAVVAAVTPAQVGDGLPVKASKFAAAPDCAIGGAPAEALPEDTGIDLQAAKLATTAAKSADPAANEPPAQATVAKGDFAEVLARAGDAQARPAVPVAAAQDAGMQRAAPATNEVRMTQPAGHESWRTELGNTLTWMATAQRQQADLVLNPPQLGRVEVSLTINGDQASAVFGSPSAAVREMIEDSLPRLREILAGAGINLGEAQVGGESRDRAATHPGADRPAGLTQPVLADATAVQSSAVSGVVRGGIGMVDVFA